MEEREHLAEFLISKQQKTAWRTNGREGGGQGGVGWGAAERAGQVRDALADSLGFLRENLRRKRVC